MKKIKLGDLLEVKHGYAFKSENYVTDSKYALVTLANISSTNNFQYNKNKLTFYGEKFPVEYLLKKDDLIMPLTEQVVGLFGNTAFIPVEKEFKFLLNQRVGKVIVNESNADKNYIHYLLATELVKKQLESRASGTRQRNISPKDIYDVEAFVCEIYEQRKIGYLLKSIENLININNKINDNLFAQISTLYNYWFIQFEFPDNNMNPYKTSSGKFIYNEFLNKNIPENWIIETLASNSISTIIKPGVEKFDYKSYYATADINNKDISLGSKISYENRESRANMQPVKNSVWFAKMKNSIKHLFITDNMNFMIKEGILSTGFCGLDCDELAFEYISSFISSPYFEIRKDILSHEATQEAVNNEDLNYIYILVPDKETLLKFHRITNPIYRKIADNICSNRKLQEIRDFLLPLLMNGRATIE